MVPESDNQSRKGPCWLRHWNFLLLPKEKEKEKEKERERERERKRKRKRKRGELTELLLRLPRCGTTGKNESGFITIYTERQKSDSPKLNKPIRSFLGNLDSNVSACWPPGWLELRSCHSSLKNRESQSSESRAKCMCRENQRHKV